MEINPIKPVEIAAQAAAGAAKPAGTEEASFKSLLADALNQVNQLQQNADTGAVKLAAGENIGLDEVMLAVQKAELALQMTTQIRNKLVDAYQEVVRMQI